MGALRVAANRPAAEVSKADERRAAQLNIRTLDDIEALVTPDGRASLRRASAQRAEEREVSNAWFALNDEKHTDAWTIIRERLDWAECTAETLHEWTTEALARVATANQRTWGQVMVVVRTRARLPFANRGPGALYRTRVQACTGPQRSAPGTPGFEPHRAERNLHDWLGWGAVSANRLVEQVQDTVLQLAFGGG